jgi:CO/xanthine dehydrogenase FAD-binding subunit
MWYNDPNFLAFTALMKETAAMALLKTVYQPTSAAEAAALLARTDEKLAPLGGGSKLIADLETRTRRDVDGVVDLSRAGLAAIDVVTVDGREYVRAGATASLTDVIDHAIAGALAGGILRRAAAGEGPLNLRNMATIGGAVASGEPDSEFYAALLALDAAFVLHDGKQEHTVRLEDLQSVAGLITAVLIPTAAARGGLSRVARTPADRPIVAAVVVETAVNAGAGEGGSTRVALCGVALRPVLLGTSLNPPDDYKGSRAYRLAMSEIVVERARALLA